MNEYKISIFDDIRIMIINTLTGNIRSRKEPIKGHETTKINSEINKLKNINFEIINDSDILIDKMQKKLLQE